MTTEEVIDNLNHYGVYSSTFNEKPCWIVEGGLREYIVDKETCNVYNASTKRYISIVDCETGSHDLKNPLPVIMALLNDVKMVEFIPTLKYTQEDWDVYYTKYPWLKPLK